MNQNTTAAREYVKKYGNENVIGRIKCSCAVAHKTVYCVNLKRNTPAFWLLLFSR